MGKVKKTAVVLMFVNGVKRVLELKIDTNHQDYNPYASQIENRCNDDKSNVLRSLRIVAIIVSAVALNVFSLSAAASFFYFTNPDEYGFGYSIILGSEVVGIICSIVILYVLVHSEVKEISRAKTGSSSCSLAKADGGKQE